MEIGKRLVAFKIGKGGRFYNGGHVSYVNMDKDINYYAENYYQLFTKPTNYDELCNEIGDRENILELLYEASVDESEKEIFEKRTGLKIKELEYVDESGNSVGLLVDNDGTGCINYDYEFNSLYVTRLEECSEKELKILLKEDITSEITEYCLNNLEYVN